MATLDLSTLILSLIAYSVIGIILGKISLLSVLSFNKYKVTESKRKTNLELILHTSIGLFTIVAGYSVIETYIPAKYNSSYGKFFLSFIVFTINNLTKTDFSELLTRIPPNLEKN